MSSLPVSASSINGDSWISDPKQGLPFNFRVPVDPVEEYLLVPCATAIVVLLQDFVDKNSARRFSYNLLSANRYNNDDFKEVLLTVIGYTQLLHSYTPNVSLETTVYNAASEVLAGLNAVYIKKFPELFNMRDVTFTQAEVEVAYRSYQTILQKLSGNHPRGVEMSTNWNPQQQQPQTQWAQPQPAQYQPQQPAQYPPQYQQPIPPPPQYSAPQQGWQQPAPQYPPQYPPQPGWQQQPPQPQFQQPPLRHNLGWGQTNAVPQNTTGVFMKPYPVGGLKAPVQNMVNPNLAQYTQPQTQQQPQQQMEVEQPKPQPKVTREYNVKMPYSIVYDPTRQVKQFVETNGVIEELVEEANTNMEYSQHEQKAVESTPIKSTGAKVIPNWAPLATTENYPTSEEGVLDLGDYSTKQLVLFDRSYTGATLKQLDAQVRARLVFDKLKFPDQVALKYTGDLVEAFPLSTELTEEIVIPRLLELADCSSIPSWIIKVKSIMSDSRFPKDLLNSLIVNSTEVVNNGLKIGLGLKWTIEDILIDWSALANEFENEMGNSGALIYQNFCDAIEDSVLTSGSKILWGSEFRDYLSKTKFLGTDFDPNRVSGVALVKQVTVTRVEWSLSELSIALEKGVGVVQRSILPNLFEVLNKLLIESKKKPQPESLYIRTNDGAYIEVSNGFLNKAHIVISLHPSL